MPHSPGRRAALWRAAGRIAGALGLVGVISVALLLPLHLLNGPPKTPLSGASQGAVQAPPGAAVAYSVVATGRASGPLHPRQPHWFSSLAIHPEGRWLISDELILGGDERWQRPFRRSTYGSRIVLRRPDTLTVIRELSGVSRVLAVSPDGERLLGLDRQGWAALWETHRWNCLMRFSPGSLEQPSGVFSSSGREIGIVDQRTQVTLWNAVTGLRTAVIPLARELSGFVGNDTACLVSSGRGWGTTVLLADARSGAILRDLGGELGHAPSNVLSADGSLVAGSERDDEILLWRTDQWTLSRRVDCRATAGRTLPGRRMGRR